VSPLDVLWAPHVVQLADALYVFPRKTRPTARASSRGSASAGRSAGQLPPILRGPRLTRSR
jgi:hypothetical protein